MVSTARITVERNTIPFTDINEAALQQLPELVAQWLPQGRRQGREWVALNPHRPDKRQGSFKVNVATGRWADFATGDRGGDPVSLYAFLFGLRQGEAARELAEAVGVQTASMARKGVIVPFPVRSTRRVVRPLPARAAVRNERPAIERIGALWEVAERQHPILDRYLQSRGLGQLQAVPALRLHPALPYWRPEGEGVVKEGEFPAVLGMIHDVAGAVVGLHRTYLCPDGSGKLRLMDEETGEWLPAKKVLSVGDRAILGGAINLYPTKRVVHLAEGIETALAVRIMTGEPVWACVSAALLRGVVLPPAIRKVTIWADRDKSGAGQEAARALETRLTKEWRKVAIRLPPAKAVDWDLPTTKSVDWLDALNAKRNWLRRLTGRK